MLNAYCQPLLNIANNWHNLFKNEASQKALNL